MREFGKIPSRLWNTKGLSFYSKALYAYLLSSPNANYFGCYLCKEGYIIADTGMTKGALHRGFEELCAASLVERLGDFVFVRGILEQDRPRNASVTASRIQEWRELGDTAARRRVAKGILTHYAHIDADTNAELNSHIDADINAELNADTNAELNAHIDADIKLTESREKRVESNTNLRARAPADKPPAPSTLRPEALPLAEADCGFSQPSDSEAEQVLPPPPPEPPPAEATARASQRNRGARLRPRNALVDAIIAASGGAPLSTTPPALKLAGIAVSEIRKACPDVTPELLRQGARNYRLAHPDWPLTPKALSNHWHTLGVRSAAQVAATSPYEEFTGYEPEPSGWRAVFCRLQAVAPEVVEGREWLTIPKDWRVEVLREIAQSTAGGKSSISESSDAPNRAASPPEIVRNGPTYTGGYADGRNA